MRRLILAALVLGGTLAAPSAAMAGVSQVLGGQTISGNPIPCVTQSDGVRVCHGSDNGGGTADLRLKTFDGVPLEIYVILPPAPSSGTDGNYPLIVQSHGWGGSAGGPNDTQFYGPTADTWAQRGYAVLQLTARGFGDSCGKATPPSALGPCPNGYIRLDDERYEARDVQYASGLLVDEGLVNPDAIGVTGESYGGGVSLELATLENRIMNSDGSLSPWTSPAGRPLHIAAAAPVIPWSDLVYSLLPNGRTRDNQITSPTADLTPIGVEKQSFVSGLFALGAASGYYSTTDPQADLPAWYAAINAGEPYDSNPFDVSLAQQIAQYHSPYYLLDGAYGAAKVPPAPLLIANGFTDDLFPVDEALRYYNLDRALYPSDPVALFDGDFGHQRAQNKPGDEALLSSAITAFFDRYLMHAGTAPSGVTATIETCPSTAPSGGPYSAATWAALHPKQLVLRSAGAQTISSAAGNPTISAAIDPVGGQGACATVPATDQGAGVATYRLPPAGSHGYTMLGSPTVTAELSITGQFPYIAARLWEVDPATNTQTLVARGVYRVTAAGVQTFQLHPGARYFAPGEIAKLELLGQDAPYLRPSNGAFQIQVTDLRLVLPLH